MSILPASSSGMFSVLPFVFLGSTESVESISLSVLAYAVPYTGNPPPGVAVPRTTTVFCCALLMSRTNVSCDRMGRRTVLASALAALLACAAPADARVTKIVLNPSADSDPVLSDGAPFPIKRITGRAYGELDPRDPHNAIIQDIRLAPRNKRGKVEYQATFQLILPSDPEKLSGLMWHDVPNRGGRVTIVAAERNAGDICLSSGWQGDNSGGTSQEFGDREVVVVPVARNPDGSAITGRVLGRIVNRSGPESEPILVQSSPLPYRPATLDTKKATLTAHSHETTDGKVTVHSVVPSRD